ncbi:MAG: DUF1697 domain-containing protein [Proteobacteria bacterium]|nr:DUF1697 domain-containing protein [Pseudomonadota bacterium]
MTTYIALLRGINVGGHKKIKMIDLRESLESFGYQNVMTYIQSGNILFRSSRQHEKVLEKAVAQLIKQRFGFDVPVMVREQNSFKTIISLCPINRILLNEKDEILVSLLSAQPEENKWQDFTRYFLEKEGLEEIYLIDRCVYFLRKEQERNTKFSNNFLENRLKVVATTRNWKTMIKLQDMHSSGTG